MILIIEEYNKNKFDQQDLKSTRLDFGNFDLNLYIFKVFILYFKIYIDSINLHVAIRSK